MTRKITVHMKRHTGNIYVKSEQVSVDFSSHPFEFEDYYREYAKSTNAGYKKESFLYSLWIEVLTSIGVIRRIEITSTNKSASY